MQSKRTLLRPDLEAEIYFLAEQEVQRNFNQDYRGQFYYDNHNWDILLQFVNKELCEPGDSVQALLQTASTEFHLGKFSVGKTFELREGSRTIARGTVTKVMNEGFHYWDGATFLEHLDKRILPYSATDDLTGYRMDFDLLLPDEDGRIIEDNIEIVMTGNPECMMLINATAKTHVLRDVVNHVLDKWQNELALQNHLYKLDYAVHTNLHGEVAMDRFTLTFATWHDLYLTGQIVVRGTKS